MDAAVRPRIWIGKDISATDYVAALRNQQVIKKQFANALEGCDALLTPTAAEAAIRGVEGVTGGRKR